MSVISNFFFVECFVVSYLFALITFVMARPPRGRMERETELINCFPQ